MLTRDQRDMVVAMESSALRQAGCALTEEWYRDADDFVEGEISLDDWKLRNEVRFTHEGLEALFNEEEHNDTQDA